MTDKTYTILQLAALKRTELLTEGTPEEDVNDLDTSFHSVLHDLLCGEQNLVFTVVEAIDGEPFVDWKTRTLDEWETTIAEFETRRAVRVALKKLLGL